MKKTSNRLVYLDWMRGLGVLIMLQGHVFESWVRPEDRGSWWFWLSQFLGGFPAPVFLFLVGVSLALVLDRMRAKGASSRELASRVLRRGAWILLLAYAFRIEQFLVWRPDSQTGDIFRVDTLNCIAVCSLVVGLLSVAFQSRRSNILAMGMTSIVFVFSVPWIYPLKGLPGFILSYLNGDGNGAYFSVFPWAAFTLVGITFGYLLLEAKEREAEGAFFARTALAGIISYAVGVAMGFTTVFEYGFFDYSLTSPHFFFVRLGWILLLACGAYAWAARKTENHWSPVIALGQASLIVYWLHIEIVYGRPFHAYSRSLELSNALLQLLWIVPLMIIVASRGWIRAKAQAYILGTTNTL